MTVEERVERLERRNRQLVMMFVAVVGVGVLLVFLASRMATAQAGSVAFEKVRAKELVIVDSLGRLRADLSVADGGGPMLALYDASGMGRVSLSMEDDSPMLALYDASGKGGIGLLVSGSSSELSLHGVAGKARASLSVARGVPALTLYDASEELRVALSVFGDVSSLSLFDTLGEPHVRLAAINESGGFLSVHDTRGREVWSAP